MNQTRFGVPSALITGAAVGVQWALGGAGCLVVLTGALAYAFSPRLRAG